jgi:hypothetical protein
LNVLVTLKIVCAGKGGGLEMVRPIVKAKIIKDRRDEKEEKKEAQAAQKK